MDSNGNVYRWHGESNDKIFTVWLKVVDVHNFFGSNRLLGFLHIRGLARYHKCEVNQEKMAEWDDEKLVRRQEIGFAPYISDSAKKKKDREK